MSMEISLRKFEEKDIPNKVKWINNPQNNKYLHYDLPLKESKTLEWYKKNNNNNNRYDAVIDVDGVPVGVIGLLNMKNKNAEYYITIGEREYLGKGIAYKASLTLINYAFSELRLEKIYLYTEEENISAQKLFEKIGFEKQFLIKNDIIYQGRNVNRFYYTLNNNCLYKSYNTLVYKLGIEYNNNLYIKRDDLFPFSFGGNKARKGLLFWKDIKEKEADYIVTYGSTSSNHCRVIANIAASECIPCLIISPKENSKDTFNRRIIEKLGGKFLFTNLSEIQETIEKTISNLKEQGYNPYFIQGGGHGNIGTQAYVDCFKEIKNYEMKNNIYFDYIFLATGTGTTQAGLVCGKELSKSSNNIVGISIARKNPYGRRVVRESILEYLEKKNTIFNEEDLVFCDVYVGNGYGKTNDNIKKNIDFVMKKYGIPLDETYTGKAFSGMCDYLKKNKIIGKNILFIHTGGTPLYFDYILIKNN